MKATLIASGSSFEMESSAWVGCPLISLIPKISEDGNDVDTRTARLGEVDGDSTSSSIAASWLHTAC